MNGDQSEFPELNTQLSAMLESEKKGFWSYFPIFLLGISLGTLFPLALKFAGVIPSQHTSMSFQGLWQHSLSLLSADSPSQSANLAHLEGQEQQSFVTIEAIKKSKKSPRKSARKSLESLESAAEQQVKEVAALASPRHEQAAKKVSHLVTVKSKNAKQIATKSSPQRQQVKPTPAVSIQQAAMVTRRSPQTRSVAAPSLAQPRPEVQGSDLVAKSEAGPGLARAVSLPAVPVSEEEFFPKDAVPELSESSKKKAKAMAMTINNATYSKASLSKCAAKCLLQGFDAFGQPLSALIDGTTYRDALAQHQGSINLSGQPRLVKNKQVLIVEQITFNLSPRIAQKPVKNMGKVSHPARSNKNFDKESYTQIPSDPDDLVPGQEVRSRKDIPIDDESEIPLPE